MIMKKVYLSVLSMLLIATVSVAQYAKTDYVHPKLTDPRVMYITDNEAAKGGEITTCPGGSLFSRPYDSPSSASTSEMDANGATYEVATSFQTIGGTIETVHIWMVSMINTGSWAACNDENPMNVNVVFYANDGGQPGTAEHTFTDLTTTLTPANVMLFGSYPVMLMSIELPSDVDMASGFVSVQGTTPAAGTNCWMLWINAPNGGGSGFQYQDGAWVAGAASFAVCLEGTAAACPAPTDFEAVSNDVNSITLTWSQTGDVTAWNIEYGMYGFTPGEGTLLEDITDNPYTVNGLSAGTIYDFYIQSDCESVWVGPITVNTTNCAPANQCGFVVDMVDDYGDGWNGGGFYVMEGDIVVDVIYLEDGDAGQQTVMLCDGFEVSLIFVSGDWDAEIGFTLSDPFGNVLATYPIGYFDGMANMTNVFTFDASCTPPTCQMPSNGEATNITTTGATLTWTENGTATAWVVEWGLATFTQGEGTVVNANATTLPLTGLTPATAYKFYVRANCGGDGLSNWAGPYVFTTGCGAITSYPFNEGFENAVPPACWLAIDNDGDTYNWSQVPNSSHPAHSGEFSAMSASWVGGTVLTPDNWLVSPQFEINANNLKLSFWVAAQDAEYPQDKFSVMVSTTGTAVGDFTEIYSLVLTSADYSEVVLPLAAYHNQSIYIAIRHWDCTDWFQMKVDDFKIDFETGIAGSVTSNMQIYPNPSNGIVTITHAEGASIEIINVMGQVVASFSADNMLTTFDASFLNTGNYIVRIIKDNNTTVKSLNIIK